MSVYNVGMLGALIGAACFLLLATFGKMPVSTTHAIVGGVVGMTLVGTSASCLNWSFDGGLSSVIASWVLSPALAGVFGVAIYFSTRRLTVLTASPRRNALRLLPLLYALSTFVMVLLVMLKSKPTKELPPYVMVASAVGAACRISRRVRRRPPLRSSPPLLPSPSPPPRSRSRSRSPPSPPR